MRRREVNPMKTRIAATIASVALLLIPAAGLAWEAGWPADLADGDEQARCPVSPGAACPAAAKMELSHLAIAAERGCPFSTTRLIERAQRCTDETIAGLARRAAEGDEKAKLELVQRIRTLMPVPPKSVNPANIA
jgi:hypothetical protein